MEDFSKDDLVNHKYFNTIRGVVRIIIGLLFIISSLLKLLSVDEFELYIYSFNIVNFSFSSLVARLVISFELICGILLITKLYYRTTWILLFFATIGFTLLLVYISIFREDSNCHCMGALVELNPEVSILKNLGILVAMIFTRKCKESAFKRRRLITIIISTLLFLLPFVLFPTDSLYRYLVKNQKNLDVVAFIDAQNDTILNKTINLMPIDGNTAKIGVEFGESKFDIEKGTFLVVFIHSSCEYCSKAMKKLRLIFEKHNLDYNHCVVFIWGDDAHICEFIEETTSQNFKFRLIDPIKAVKITTGKFPTLAIFKDGKIAEIYNYMSLNENSLVEHLQ